MQIESLKEINLRMEVALVAGFLGPYTEEEHQSLLDEIARRQVTIRGLNRELRVIQAELKKRNLPPPESSATGIEVNDDPDICQYCLTNTRDTEFSCCGHNGACAECLYSMAKTSRRCPNCRVADPVVAAPTKTARLSAFMNGSSSEPALRANSTT